MSTDQPDHAHGVLNIFTQGPFMSMDACPCEWRAAFRILNTSVTLALSTNRSRSSCGTSDASSSRHIMSKIALSSLNVSAPVPTPRSFNFCRWGMDLNNRSAATTSCSWSPLASHLSMSTAETPSWRWRSATASSWSHCHLPFFHMTAICA